MICIEFAGYWETTGVNLPLMMLATEDETRIVIVSYEVSLSLIESPSRDLMK